jgi:hypothetical protein
MVAGFMSCKESAWLPGVVKREASSEPIAPRPMNKMEAIVDYRIVKVEELLLEAHVNVRIETNFWLDGSSIAYHHELWLCFSGSQMGYI